MVASINSQLQRMKHRSKDLAGVNSPANVKECVDNRLTMPILSRRLHPVLPNEAQKSYQGVGSARVEEQEWGTGSVKTVKVVEIESSKQLNKESVVETSKRRSNKAFEATPFYNKVKSRPTIHKQVRYKYIESSNLIMPLESSVVHENKTMECNRKEKIPITLNRIYYEEMDK